MLHIRPSSWWSDRYTVHDDAGPLTEVNIRWVRDAGSFTLGSETYKLGREGWMSGDFYVSRGTQRLARADKPSAFHRRFVVHVGSTKYELRATSAFSRKFTLFKGGRRVGTVEPASFWSRKATADLPEELAVEIRIFLIWLVLVLWKRARQSNTPGTVP